MMSDSDFDADDEFDSTIWHGLAIAEILCRAGLDADALRRLLPADLSTLYPDEYADLIAELKSMLAAGREVSPAGILRQLFEGVN